MSLTAVLLVKVLSDLPRTHVQAVLALGPLSVAGFAASPGAYRTAPWLGLAAAVAASLLAAAVVVTVASGYERCERSGQVSEA